MTGTPMKNIAAAVALLLVSAFAQPARAASEPDVALLDGGYSGSTGKVLMGVDIRMPAGWHTYWKSPGDGGYGPETDLTGSTNVSSFRAEWPVPERIDLGGVSSVGYRDRLLLPVVLTPRDPSLPVTVKLKLRLYACKDYCMAFDRSLEAAIAPGAAEPSTQKEIASWLGRAPRTRSDVLSVGAVERVDALTLSIPVTSSVPFAKPEMFVATDDNTGFSVEWRPGRTGEGRFLAKAADTAALAGGKKLEVVLADGKAAVSAERTVPAAQASLDPAILLTALFGGLILNLMPCVFPVLALKLSALASGDVRAARRGFAASSAGIVLSFLALATMLVAVRAAGGEIGWGVQFQSPAFAVVTGTVVAAFALSLSGFFEIALPSAVATRLTLMTDGRGAIASLAQGFVATLLATPCSAPFVGTAVGFALAGNALDIYAVFGAMGAGMAAPYLAVAGMPGLARLLPRPGAWMSFVRRGLALALFGTAGWLFSVAAVTGSAAFQWAWAGIVIGALIVGTIHAPRGVGRGFVLAASLAAAAPIALNAAATGVPSSAIRWQPFDESRVAGVLASGGRALVYVTADWCLTCKVNEKTTFSDGRVVARLNSLAAPMRADWTRPDGAISRFMKEHGRFGVPFTVVFSPAAPEGTILPELLDPATVLDAVK